MQDIIQVSIDVTKVKTTMHVTLNSTQVERQIIWELSTTFYCKICERSRNCFNLVATQKKKKKKKTKLN